MSCVARHHATLNLAETIAVGGQRALDTALLKDHKKAAATLPLDVHAAMEASQLGEYFYNRGTSLSLP